MIYTESIFVDTVDVIMEKRAKLGDLSSFINLIVCNATIILDFVTAGCFSQVSQQYNASLFRLFPY